MGHIEDMMKGNSQFHNTQPRPQMATGLRYRIDHFSPDLVSKLLKLFRLKFVHIIGASDLIKQFCHWSLCWLLFWFLTQKKNTLTLLDL